MTHMNPPAALEGKHSVNHWRIVAEKPASEKPAEVFAVVAL